MLEALKPDSFARTLQLARSQPRLMGAVLLLGFPAAIAEALALLLIASAAVAATGGTQRSTELPFGVTLQLSVTNLAIVAGILILIAGLGRLAVGWIRADAVAEHERALRSQLVQAYLRADFPTQQGLTAGALVDLSSTAVIRSGSGVNAVAQVVLALASLGVFVGGAVLVQPLVGLLLVAVGGGLLFSLRPMTRALQRAAKRYSRSSIEQAEGLAEAVAISREVSLFDAERAVMDDLSERIAESAVHRQRGVALTSFAPVLFQTAGLLLIATTIAFAGSISGDSLGRFGGAALLLLRSLTYGQRLQTSTNILAESLVYTDRIYQAIADLGERTLSDGPRPFRWPQPIRLKTVSYRYPVVSAEEQAIRRVDLEFAAHETVGIVGPSGSGKSTLADLILRLRDPVSGQLWLGDEEAADINLREWRAAIALVPQSTVLVPGTIADNIRFFRESVSEDDVRQAAISAGLEEMISGLPEGYETQIGTRGRDLSGGQRQRIGIARALAANPCALVLDEPTSALDSESEAVVRDALIALAGERLIVIIAHRGSALQLCDRLIVLEDGQVVDVGTPDALRARNRFVDSMLSEQRGDDIDGGE